MGALYRKVGNAMIVLDLEWNSGLYERVKLDEILQIGAVKVKNGVIVSRYDRYIRPVIHKRFSPAAAALPELEKMKSSTWDFPAAYLDFLSWCDGDECFATWSGNDMIALLTNRKYWKLEPALPTSFIDLQKAYGARREIREDISLTAAVEQSGLKTDFSAHNALSDAENAWLVCQGMAMEELEKFRRLNPLIAKKQTKLPSRKNPWQGPFQTTAEALSNRGVRRGVCPKCGAVSRVNCWYPEERGGYLGGFVCPQCGGSHVLRAELRRRGDKGYWANAAAHPDSGQWRERFRAAGKKTPVEVTARRRKRKKSSTLRGEKNEKNKKMG